MTDYVHRDPVWRDRADFLIAGKVPSDDGGWEQLWARSISSFTFEICCIPFFLYDLALGDAVETNENYEIQRVATRSGRYVFRAWLKGSLLSRAEFADHLVGRGCLVEWSSENLCAVDAADETLAQAISDLLQSYESRGHLTFETGLT